jgi:hypothetical protein
MKNTAAAESSRGARRGRTRNAETLGIRLEPFMAPSRRHPEGAARCRGVTRRDGLPRQCRRKARDGFPVCSHHGAGSRKRERAGTAKNPALVRLKTGKRAKASTLEQLVRERPELQSLCEMNVGGGDVLDMRPLVARMKAITETLVSDADSCDGSEAQANTLIAIQGFSHLTRALHHMQRMEERVGPVRHAHVKGAVEGILSTVREFVPEDRRKDALDFICQLVVGGDQQESALTEDETSLWTEEMLDAFKEGVPANLVRLMRDPHLTRRLEGIALFKFERDGRAQDKPAAPSLYAKNERLLDLRGILAQVKPLAERLASRTHVHDVGDGRKDALSVLEALSDVMRAASEMLHIEQRLGPVLYGDLRRLTDSILAAIEKFVPAERRGAARWFLFEEFMVVPACRGV